MISPPWTSALLARLRLHAIERPDAVAYHDPATSSLTYQQLAARVAALAKRLQRDVPPGAVVLLSAPNQLQYPIAFLGILAAGCTVFPLSAEAADAELQRAATESAASAVIGNDRAVNLFASSLSHVIPSCQLPDESAVDLKQEQEISGDLLLQSSGTTGLPKIARRTGQSLDAVSRAMAESIGFRPDDRVLMTIPLTHSYGLEHGLLAPIWAGSAVHLTRGLDLNIILPQLATAGITIFPGVPSTFEMLAASSAQMPTLRLAYSAGAPLPRSVFDAFAKRHGVRITQLYGATEIGSVAFNPPTPDCDPASVGLPMRGVDIRILNPDTDTPLPVGHQGQVAIRAASMFSGYLSAPAGLIDGYFPTGDLGHLDPTGRLFVTGRIKLLIDVGGMKVNPLEVEAVLQQHPAVAACVVIPIRQSQTVFRLKAIITPRDPSRPPAIEDLRCLAREHLASYKIPRLFEFRTELPRSTTGKILRHLVEVTGS